jgi:hypothetical protein
MRAVLLREGELNREPLGCKKENKREDKENFMKCRICDSQVEANMGKRCTPREIANAPKDPAKQESSFYEKMSAVSVYSDAGSIVLLDSSQVAELPKYLICSKCLKTHFGIEIN